MQSSIPVLAASRWRLKRNSPSPCRRSRRHGLGLTGYNHHSVLKTPNLDALAANSPRFERFYADSPFCSPTRAIGLTGRSHDRTGVFSHGHALRLQEKTVAPALKGAGYITGRFGKWYLKGHRGRATPIFAA